MEKGYNMIYAKSGGRPFNIYFDYRIDVINFFLENLNNIDFLCINDVIIDKNKLIENSISLARYLKLKKINDI